MTDSYRAKARIVSWGNRKSHKRPVDQPLDEDVPVMGVMLIIACVELFVVAFALAWVML